MESPDRVKDRYNVLAKKYNLPKWDVLDKEFELLYINPVLEIRSPLSFVLNRVGDQLSNRVDNLHSIFNPPQHNMILVKEHSFLNDDDKKLAIKLLTQIMTALVNASLIENKSDKTLADALKLRLDAWKKTKKPYAKIIKKIEYGWKHTSKQ